MRLFIFTGAGLSTRINVLTGRPDHCALWQIRCTTYHSLTHSLQLSTILVCSLHDERHSGASLLIGRCALSAGRALTVCIQDGGTVVGRDFFQAHLLAPTMMEDDVTPCCGYFIHPLANFMSYIDINTHPRL